MDYDRLQEAERRRREISSFSEPLARAAYDLQSRLYNILKQDLVRVYITNGGKRESQYVVNNTVFLIAQYFCWTEIIRREIQFIDLGEDSETRALLCLQDTIYSQWGTDGPPPRLRIFAGEQRAIGDSLIQIGARGPECIGYGRFLNTFSEGKNPLIDALRSEITALETELELARERLTKIQRLLVNLIDMLDPDQLRFPRDRRTKL